MNNDLHTFIKPFRRHENDNWSPEIQVAIISFEVQELQDHLKLHIHDIDAKRSLLKKVARRRKYLKYLKTKDLERYSLVSKKLKLKV